MINGKCVKNQELLGKNFHTVTEAKHSKSIIIDSAKH